MCSFCYICSAEDRVFKAVESSVVHYIYKPTSMGVFLVLFFSLHSLQDLGQLSYHLDTARMCTLEMVLQKHFYFNYTSKIMNASMIAGKNELQALCGNGIVEEKEECDVGFVEKDQEEKCCDENCQFKPNVTCRYGVA